MTGESENLDFWTMSAEGYSKGVAKELENKENRKWLDAVLSHAPKKKKLKILDVGCGPGYFTILFTQHGHDVTGIDITEAMIEQARKNAKNQGVNPPFSVMNANCLDFDDNTFDMVICRYVTWTLPDAMDCYREWKRVLVPGGRILIFDGNHYLNVFTREKAALLRRQMRETVLKGNVVNDHSDFHARSTFMLTRPLIGTPRPEWDRNTMIKLDMVNITTEENYFNEVEADSMAPTFVICAEKASPLQEKENRMDTYWNGVCPVASARTALQLRDGIQEKYVQTIAGQIPEGSKVLDMGCGTGNVTIPLTKAGYDVVGVDRAEFMIDEARTCASEAGVECRFEVGDITNLGHPDKSFDAVILRNVVWSSFRPERIYIEATRLLKTGGVLIVTDGRWLEHIREWESANEDRGYFPNYTKRDMGFGGTDCIEALESELPLLNVCRPAWDCDILERLGCSAESECFDDPIDEDVRDALGHGFLIKAVKN